MHAGQTTSIRARLEHLSARRNPELHRQDRRTARAKRRRRRDWPERALITVACLLGCLLLLRVGDLGAQPPAATTHAPDGPVTEPVQAAPTPWGLTLQSGDRQSRVLALDTLLHAEVSGLLARVEVVQSFRNDTLDWVEGTYRYPLPDGAAVDQLFVRVGERVLEGVVRERETARRVYQQARREGRAAGLVSQERANQFSTRLANIGPGESVHVMIGFLVQVEYGDGAFRLRLPMTFTPRWGVEAQPGSGRPAPGPRFTAHGHADSHRLELGVELDAGVPLAGVESLHHDVDIETRDGGYRVTLVDPEERTDRDFELVWYPEFGAEPRSALTTWSDGTDVFAQLMLIPPRDEALDPAPREVVFVVDTSGSMAGASIEQARIALLAGLAELGAGDRFNLLQFNSITEPLFAAPVPVTDANLEAAMRWIDRLEANGGTEMGPALRQALAPPRAGPIDPHAVLALPTSSGATPALPPDLVRQVVFITDGAVGNERALLAEIADRLGGSRLFTVAIGSAPNAGFMRKAAEIGRGHHTRIGRPEDVQDAMTALWTYLRLPAITDLCIDWGQDAEYYPEILPDLYAGQPLWVTARLPETPKRVRLCGALNDRPWQFDAWPRAEPGPDLLATLWARKKVEALQDSVLFGADPEQMRAEATRVALDHDLLTPWTSLVAVDRTPARPAGQALTGTEVPALLPAGSTMGTPFPGTATGWKAQLMLSLLVLSVSSYLFLRPFAPMPRRSDGCAGPGRSGVAQRFFRFRSPVLSALRGRLNPRP